ncbi:MAG: hypothetical protein OEV28_13825, partial [Nitrospirota bacterium]|nr:hypothetical protein [Nitrospirota bacterium]
FKTGTGPGNYAKATKDKKASDMFVDDTEQNVAPEPVAKDGEGKGADVDTETTRETQGKGVVMIQPLVNKEPRAITPPENTAVKEPQAEPAKR